METRAIHVDYYYLPDVQEACYYDIRPRNSSILEAGIGGSRYLPGQYRNWIYNGYKVVPKRLSQ
jgi:hypothetical protein